MPTQPLGWFKKPITKAEDFKGLKFRTVGISIDVFTGMGAAVNALPGGEIVPAMDRGLLDAAEFNNASSDRILGFADVSKVCMLQSYHQNAEQFEIMFNKAKYDALPDEDAGDHRQRRRGGLAGHVVEGDRPLLEGLHRAADQGQGQVLQDAGRGPADASSRSTTRSSAKKAAENPLFKEIVESQIAFAERAVQWEQDTDRQPPHGVQPLLRAASRAEEADLTPAQPARHHPATAGWCFVCRRPAAQLTRMTVQRFLHTIDGISTWVGKAAAWLIVVLIAAWSASRSSSATC